MRRVDQLKRYFMEEDTDSVQDLQLVNQGIHPCLSGRMQVSLRC